VATRTRIVVVHERSEKAAAMFEGAMDAPEKAGLPCREAADAWACMACCEWEAALSMVGVEALSWSWIEKSPPWQLACLRRGGESG